MSSSRKLSYSLAINEALHQMMAADPSVFVIGQGVTSPWYVGNTTQGLPQRFGDQRVIDSPISENAITGAAVGAAIVGMKPVVVHPRMDFMLYAMDPIINQAANWHYMNGGKSTVPVVFWCIINRGGEQAAQHSQALHATFAHIPGLKVVAPTSPYEAKGLMIAAIKDPNPVVFIDDRWLYRFEEAVPEEIYELEIGRGEIRRAGSEVTLVAASFMTHESVKAVQQLVEQQIDVEFINLRTIKPLDQDLILESVKKTGRLVIVDGGWKTCGLAAEIAALVCESAFEFLKAAIMRVTLPDCPAPASKVLEKAYYPTSETISAAVRQLLKKSDVRTDLNGQKLISLVGRSTK
jgi:acetoin:2,6-dichlorophenolindophenol oxidoreductase subunit beta